MARVVRPGGRVVVLEITTPQRPPLSTFFRLWFDRVVPALGRVAGDPQAYSYLPNSVKRFPAPAELAAVMSRCGLTEIRYLITAGGIIALHVGSGAAMNAVQAVVEAGGAEVSRADAARRAADGRAGQWARSAARPPRRRDDRRRRQAAAAAARVPRRRAFPRRRPTAWCARRSRSSSCTGRRSCTTTCSTARRCGAADRRWSLLGGRRLATATGDLLFSRAFAELAAGGSLEAVRILSRASSELAAGELMQRSDAWDASVGVERYLERCRLKTAVLFRAACELGRARGSGGSPMLLGSFGERIGVAFQLLDDVLDVSGPPERTGKPRGADLLDGTVTLPLIVARERDQELASVDLRASARRRARRPRCASGSPRPARSRSSRARALELVAAAKALLQALTERQRAALELVADGVVERYA